MPADLRQEITPELMLRAYATGIFPMAASRSAEQVFWVDPDLRGVIPLDGLHVPRRLVRTFRNAAFEVRVSSAFATVLDACAERPDTWINADIRALYLELHARGHAHSIEIWTDASLAGGLYGVSLGAAFFGESMFSRRRDASKLALIALVARLRFGGFRLLDTQFLTEHLASLGAIEIPRAAYRRALAHAIPRQADFHRLPGDASRQEMLQLSTQMS
jgi:leucyl/phenylalanyl-tRNA---protein transferase